MEISKALQNYPINCTFCESKINSKKCQLPFQIANELVLNQDPFSALIELGDVHTKYGIQNLINNFNFRINSDNSSLIKERNETQSEYVHESKIPDTTDGEVKIDTETSHATISDIDESGNKTTLGVEIEPNSYARKAKMGKNESSISDEHSSSRLSWDEMVQEEEGLQSLTIQKTKRKGKESKGKERITELPKPKEYLIHKITANEELHLVNDLAIAAITARGIKEAKRSHINQNQMIESIIFETDVRSRKSINYKPKRDITLDGQIGLSKAIIARHNHDQIIDWESEAPIRDTHLCILSHPTFKANGNEYLTSKLDDALVNYVFDIRRSSTLDQNAKTRIFDILKFELEREMHSDIYQWIMNTSTSSRVPRLRRTTHRESTSNASTDVREETKSSKSEHREPVVDESYLQFIEIRLMSIVKKITNNNKELNFVTNDDVNSDKLFYKLVACFIKHNKGWQNKDSFHSGRHMSQIEELTGIPIPEHKAYLVFQTISDILEMSRRKFKETTGSAK